LAVNKSHVIDALLKKPPLRVCFSATALMFVLISLPASAALFLVGSLATYLIVSLLVLGAAAGVFMALRTVRLTVSVMPASSARPDVGIEVSVLGRTLYRERWERVIELNCRSSDAGYVGQWDTGR
jgi:O-antigen ligase